jgi:hypothetical protein
MSFHTLSAAALVLVAGCSLMIDTEKKQCTQPQDCGLFNAQPLYACVQNFCEKPACTADGECQSRGSFVCNSNACEPADCLVDHDCTKAGQSCVAGRCTDPVFSCFTQKQPVVSSDPAVLKLKLVAYGETKPLTNLKVRVCATADLACNSPIAAETAYDDQGILSISKLENGVRYSLRFSASDSSGSPLLDAEYYMLRPVVGLTTEADKLEMVPEALVNVLAQAAGTTWVKEQGLVLAETFGCDLKPLAHVSLTDSRMASLFYLTGAASTSTTETDGAGVGGFVNMEVDNAGNAVQHKLTFSYGGRPMFSFLAAPRPKVLTFLQIYLGDYGTTSERAAEIMH